MSDARTQAITLLYWSMLVTGASLAGAGLVRSLARQRDWFLADSDDEGEIAIGDGRLEAGQSVMVAPGDRRFAADPSGVVAGQIASIGRKHCVLALDFWPGATERLNNRASSESRSEPFHPQWPNVGANVTVTVNARAEVYRFAARIRNSQQADGELRLFVARPGILTRIQRRRHARVTLDVPATFERVWSTGSDVSRIGALRTSAPIHGTVRNISGSGLRANVGGVLRIHELDAMLRLFAPETIVRIGLPFPSLPRTSLLARICSSARAATPGGLALQIACQFLPMPVWEQENVIQHVFQLRREQTWTAE